MRNVFDGLRVLDLTHVLAGPFASYQMGLLGADVIKVEAPNAPDQARYQGSNRAMNDEGLGTAFLTQGANKRALALDLKTEGGRDVLKRLAETADVLVENYRPGALEALGLGYDALRMVNPRLVYCSISAFGSTGPRREQTGYDNVLQAFSGIMEMTGFTSGDHPLKTGAPVIDYATGTTAAFAISAALLQRERDGVGQFVDVSMLEVALVLCSSHVANFTLTGRHPEKKGNAFPFATIGCYAASDAPLMLAASNLRQQRRLWEALGRPDMVKTDNNQRLDGHREEAEALADIFATKTADEWERFLGEHRVPAARIRRMEEALGDPQVRDRGFIHTFGQSDGSLGGLGVPGTAFRMTMSETQVRTPPQPVGAQTRKILEELSLSPDEIDALVRDGAAA